MQAGDSAAAAETIGRIPSTLKSSLAKDLDFLTLEASVYAAVGNGADDRLDQRALDAMTAYVAAHPKNKLGVHGYDLAEFGLVAAQLAERFSGYVSRYDVAPEASHR